MRNLACIDFNLRNNGIGIITLNKPEKMNLISLQFIEELHQILDSLITNLNCRVIILRAKGEVFCAGLDLKESAILNKKKLPDIYRKYSYLDISEVGKRILYLQYRLSDMIKKMREISQPIIAAIHGAASGGGFALALAADIRIASSKARFNNAFINIGLSGSDVGTSYFLPRLIGLSRATEILYSGRFINAQEAKNIGLVSEIVKKERLLPASLDIARTLLNKSPLGLRMTKEAINISMDSPSLDTITQLENRAQIICAQSNDALEAGLAFFQKRNPKYPQK